ncbi:sensor histidine kinase [Sphingobium sp. Ant17]|uniref:sensor histidine kinase n=1 Tax=Sphingobium sp. Ant17 TaxID=1461752 RepID=UPI0004B3E232|nr:sensor histidine kinase [Sphingobium sp. Ant17]
MNLPQPDFRGVSLDWKAFRDLAIIGMAGLTDYLMDDTDHPFIDGMVNYKRVVDALGLTYAPDWIDDLRQDLENFVESIASHDSAPVDDQLTGGHWVYLNSGFSEIASLLYKSYYVPPAARLSYDEFRDILIFELVGMAQDGVGENGGNPDSSPPTYDLKLVSEHFALPTEPGWIERASTEFLHAGFIARESGQTADRERYVVTREGYEHAQTLSERLSEADGLLLSGGRGSVYFSVDASHISRLGLELVAKQETAVAELVKNGYDADATNVELIFREQGGSTSLDIFDNGSGMDMAQLSAGFMRLSTPNKVAAPLSAKYNRQKAGRKGIGRFAAQRLGRRLVLETATAGTRFGLRLEIEWEHFTAERDLVSVPIAITRIEKPFAHGTMLRIFDLRDSWSTAQIERSHRHIAELIQPFPLASTSSEEDGDPGFLASFVRERNGAAEVLADAWTAFFQHALAEIEGNVDGEGRASWAVTSGRFNIAQGAIPIGPTKEDPSACFSHLRDVKFKAYYYIDKETQRSFRSKVAEKLQSNGGIRLYRNGFRVLPYGERFDDWLKLNASNLLRKVLPPHSNRNFLGFVEISDVDGTQFEETSSREGLVENESFIELKEFVSSVLKTAILPIAAARDRRLTTTDTRQKQRSPKGQADDILARLATLEKNARDNPQYAIALSQVVDSVRQSVVEIGDTGEALLEELGMVRVLSSLGLAIGEFTHEIRLALEAVKASVSLLAVSVSDSENSSEKAEQLFDQLADFEGYLTYFDATVRDNVSREVSALEIRDVVNSFLGVVSPKIKRNELSMDKSFDGYGLFTRPMHKSEWASILINLFTNSLKAIRRAGVQGKIMIECGRADGMIYLDFMDNGDGIPAANSKRIFDAFFTTTSLSGASDEDGTFAGMGMGLKIVRDIVETAEGQIVLQDPKSGFSTCLRVLVPEASDEEIPSNAY